MPKCLKRADETFDELLERIAKSEKPVCIGAWSKENCVFCARRGAF